MRLGILTAVSAVLMLSLCRLPARRLSVTCLDVGQGDCIFIRNGGGCCLIDAGSSDVEDVSTRRILPYLRNRGVSRLDLLILTHTDGDHMNGMLDLLEDPALSVGSLVISEAASCDPALDALRSAAARRNVPVRIIQAGDGWEMGKDRFSCIYPGSRETEKFENSDVNNTSLVIRLEGEEMSVLFTGDLGEEGERELLAGDGLSNVDVLKVGHHGSRFSSCAEFLDALSPEIGLISCSAGNRYGHPHPETIERLEACSCRTAATKDFGALTVSFSDGKIRLYGFRKPDGSGK